METIPIYVEALPEREAVLHLEGEDIELPPGKEEESYLQCQRKQRQRRNHLQI
jgi:hypothetical protein